MWSGRPAICIGGGPSLLDFDWRRLEGWLTIGVNRVFERHDPTIIFTMDRTFYVRIQQGRYGAAAVAAWARSRAIKVLLKSADRKDFEGVVSVPMFRSFAYSHRAFPFTLASGLGHGNNSGYGALNLAVCLGANPIYLLGYDMKHQRVDSPPTVSGVVLPPKFRSHWHEGHPRVQREATVTRFIDEFNRASLEIAKHGIAIINLNPDSALKCFRPGDVDAVLGPALAAEEARCP
jgi:hypothetical protein